MFKNGIIRYKKSMQLYVSVINSLNKEALSLPDKTEYCNTEETVDDIKDIADSSLFMQPFGAYFHRTMAKLCTKSVGEVKK